MNEWDRVAGDNVRPASWKLGSRQAGLSFLSVQELVWRSTLAPFPSQAWRSVGPCFPLWMWPSL